MLSGKDHELLLRVDEVLHYLWDPIGVSGVAAARDEYSSYSGVVVSMLKRKATVKEISKYLADIRRNHMGLGREDSLAEDDIAEIVLDWRDTIFPE